MKLIINCIDETCIYRLPKQTRNALFISAFLANIFGHGQRQTTATRSVGFGLGSFCLRALIPRMFALHDNK